MLLCNLRRGELSVNPEFDCRQRRKEASENCLWIGDKVKLSSPQNKIRSNHCNKVYLCR